jgi:hypothetical protein
VFHWKGLVQLGAATLEFNLIDNLTEEKLLLILVCRNVEFKQQYLRVVFIVGKIYLGNMFKSISKWNAEENFL